MTKEKDHEYLFLCFLSFFDVFSGIFLFSVILEDLLYLVFSSRKLKKNINALKLPGICVVAVLFFCDRGLRCYVEYEKLFDE